ncbi:MAG TPA: 4Fe-4S dicluster-binding protein [Balneolaceae bacterium]|nr:4Fe-4S dicluster-binding protein [Balneolaceae bacterium]
MSNSLKKYSEILVGGTVIAKEVEQPETGSWRLGLKPEVDLDKCVDCLLCWINCPDTAVMINNDSDFTGFDYTYCKGCELCAEICPTDAIQMVAEDKPVAEFGRKK